MIAVYTQHDRIIVSVLTAWAEMLHENMGKGYHHVLRIRDSTSVVYVAGTEPGVPATFYAIFHACYPWQCTYIPYAVLYKVPEADTRREIPSRICSPDHCKGARGQNVIKQKQRNDSKDL